MVLYFIFCSVNKGEIWVCYFGEIRFSCWKSGLLAYTRWPIWSIFVLIYGFLWGFIVIFFFLERFWTGLKICMLPTLIVIWWRLLWSYVDVGISNVVDLVFLFVMNLWSFASYSSDLFYFYFVFGFWFWLRYFYPVFCTLLLAVALF